jgi:hypothetical protein
MNTHDARVAAMSTLPYVAESIFFSTRVEFLATKDSGLIHRAGLIESKASSETWWRG